MEVGAKVRLEDAAYRKAPLRGNDMKQGPRWSRRVYTVTHRHGQVGHPHQYRVAHPKVPEVAATWFNPSALQQIPVDQQGNAVAQRAERALLTAPSPTTAGEWAAASVQ